MKEVWVEAAEEARAERGEAVEAVEAEGAVGAVGAEGAEGAVGVVEAVEAEGGAAVEGAGANWARLVVWANWAAAVTARLAAETTPSMAWAWVCAVR